MGLKDWLRDFISEEDAQSIRANQSCFAKLQGLIYCRYAQAIVAERYGSLLSKSEFITYLKGEVKKTDTWYRLNVEPNPNQSSSEFMKQLANRLVFNGEALIVRLEDNSLYVAKEFTKGIYQVGETRFSDVTIDIYEDGTVNEYALKGVFYGERAIYIKYTNQAALNFIAQMNDIYASLIDNVGNSGSSAVKYALNIDATALNGVDIDINEEITRLTNDDFNALVNNNDAIVPLLNGFKLDVINPSNNNSQNATIASINIDKMFNDVLANVGHIYNVPKSFMQGTYEKNDLDEFLTFGLDSMAQLIGECVNRKYYGKKQILEGTYCRLDTKKVKHFDILTISDSINKLISSGVYSINEVRVLLDEPLIDKEIGDVHWVTRNYAVIGDYLKEQSNYTANDKKTAVARESE